MWEVPQTSLQSRGLRDLARELHDRHGLDVTPGRLAVRARHAITFRRIRLEGYRAHLRRTPPRDPDRYAWVRPEELGSVPVSSMTRKLVQGLLGHQLPLELE
jgi:hypothetical protein